mmetsp:Transcript_97206/g.225352  ORF Transcript_97206/g.225352 Transcript_97206/m.225352 type:complete len:179 (+) Transcript_97206:228-764(+)
MIDPRTKREGEDREAYCRRRWGGSGWAPQFQKWDWWPNTLNAHRLCLYIDKVDAQRSDLTQREKDERSLNLIKKFYELTYDRGLNISTPAGAAQALEELGYAKAVDAVRWLEEGGGFNETVAQDTSAKQEKDIHGVPHFEIFDPTGTSVRSLHGAQKSGAFLAAFEQVSGGKRQRPPA